MASERESTETKIVEGLNIYRFDSVWHVHFFKDVLHRIKNPFDFLICSSDWMLAIEAKELDLRSKKSFPFCRIKPHQLANLRQVESLSPRYHAGLVVRFKNHQLGNACYDVAYLIPITLWDMVVAAKKPRKGIHYKECESLFVKCIRGKGNTIDLYATFNELKSTGSWISK